MSKHDKLIKRLQGRPKDFQWAEAMSLLLHLGFEVTKGSGPRRKFIHKEKNLFISFHEPHPEKTLKTYIIDAMIKTLKEGGYI